MRAYAFLSLISRIGDAAFGWLRRRPTPSMRSLALVIAEERGIKLPEQTLRSFSKTREFLNRYAYYKIG